MRERVLARVDELRPEWVKNETSWGAGVRLDCPRHRKEHQLVLLFSTGVDGYPVNPDASAMTYVRAGASFSTLTFRDQLDLGPCFSGWLIDGEFLTAESDH